MRFVLSTIGTSILTNLINRSEPAEANWLTILRESANLKEDALPPESKAILDTLTERALEALLSNDVRKHRRISAELNGIYAIYDNQLDQASQDIHYLICTDTAQGQATGKLIQDFLHDQDIRTEIFIPSGLSTQDTTSFSEGIKDLIRWCEETIPPYGVSQYQIIFNLVGSFKSLQGYLNTIGMFYANEVIYIFEAETADLIKIPRLPIQIDTALISAHVLKFVMMSAGQKLYPIGEVAGIPETLLESVTEKGKTYAGLSAWGELIWNRTKADFLVGKLLDFPMLTNKGSFRDDFKRLDNKERVRLQEKLARIATILEEDNGNTARLRGGGIQLEEFTQHKGISKFRIADDIRVSCIAEGQNGLTLLKCGSKQSITQKPR